MPRKPAAPPPVDPRSRPPWDGPTAHTMLDAKAPGTLPGDRQAKWVELLAGAIGATATNADAAEALGVPLRTFCTWLARVEADYPELERQIPARRPPGRQDNPAVAAWLAARAQKPA